ncbi:hypothetical protein DMN91_001381 [Ooceraea biroi]|uniref:UDP-glucuronosyltransferase n=1 Tax=Ooceraea biroi TaxID=2015173 RepID=A0A3L8E4I3_OOCBI|nr:hypothetical protein DMN91_001381 [Ooceraea biroi]
MLLKLVLIVPILWIVADAARILGVFPYPSYSHQIIFRSLTTELARRGHELMIFTTDPINDSTLQNYTEIDLHYYYDSYAVNFYSKHTFGIWTVLSEVYKTNNKLTDWTLSHPVMQRLLSPNSTEKFDLIIMQSLYLDALYGISFRLDAPLIAITPNPPLAIHHYKLGNPMSAAYAPDLFLGVDGNMNMWQRFLNMYYYLRQFIEYEIMVIPSQEKISRKYFGDSMPPVHQFSSKISLLLDLENILNDAKEGFIYFSLGSNVKSNQLPAETRNMLLRTFAELPYKVLWKFESDYLPDKPDNVIIRKWLPQEAILAHPNIRLFIYQGGLQSTGEAIEHAVPVISFPVYCDQMLNIKRLQSYGTGKMLQLTEVSGKTLKETIFEIITNSSYKENMRKLRYLLQDLPYNPMDNAIWWVEHVIRHKGAPHLRNKSRDMPWYQVELLDIMAIIIVIAILAIRIIIAVKRYVFFKMSKQLMLKIKTKLINNVKKQQ